MGGVEHEAPHLVDPNAPQRPRRARRRDPVRCRGLDVDRGVGQLREHVDAVAQQPVARLAPALREALDRPDRVGLEGDDHPRASYSPGEGPEPRARASVLARAAALVAPVARSALVAQRGYQRHLPHPPCAVDVLAHLLAGRAVEAAEPAELGLPRDPAHQRGPRPCGPSSDTRASSARTAARDPRTSARRSAGLARPGRPRGDRGPCTRPGPALRSSACSARCWAPAAVAATAAPAARRPRTAGSRRAAAQAEVGARTSRPSAPTRRLRRSIDTRVRTLWWTVGSGAPVGAPELSLQLIAGERPQGQSPAVAEPAA